MIAIILTHEQADFDALGAALGAHLMDEKSIPVAPRRMNRNVRAFLTLYGAELPFVDPRDLPPEPIGTVTLVDTQSLVTLKGMSQKTAIQVVDHHALRSDLPDNWNVTIDPVGACTTLFVEGLREHNGVLNPIHATLLMLGIYEDTGSLTYTNTTARDVRAAAYLLEQGASLQIISRYLNPPLSDEQRQVYDRLLSSAHRLTIHGHNILVAIANAEDLNDEISTIAHKLRDLLDPDALFLLVRTVEGIRLVARSVTDAVDVAEIAEQLGGGGHGRAAAALIRVSETTGPDGQVMARPTLEEIYQRLLDLLPRHVHPSATVRQMMSPHPLVLTPDTPAETAHRLMQRYGYEGYPVVANGKVVGLLTRRAVDRAIAHRLNLPASSLMEAGEVTVKPSDSIEHLRRVMIDSGWGQVPVVDPDTGQVIGIVTRTDLLKHMAGGAPLPGRQNLAPRLEAALPPARLALLKTVASVAHEHRTAVYVVGGFVRDLLLDRPSLDFDVVVEGDAIALARALVKKYGGRVQGHSRFGTAKWSIAADRERLAAQIAPPGAALNPADLPDSLDLISARTEFYDYPTALPTVERSNIKLDLHRRDFTINTMALRLDGRHYGELYDYWGGLRDLRRGLIRVLHSLSFVDDPTRLMRAVRFEQRFGFEIEERTRQLMAEARPLVRQVSGDRLRHEFNLILAEQQPQPVLARLAELDLLSAVHPALTWPARMNAILETILHGEIPPEWPLPEKIGNLSIRQALAYLVWFLHYPPEEARAIGLRLRMPGDLLNNLEAAARLREEIPTLLNARPSQITARLDQVPMPALYGLFLFSEDAATRDLLERYVHTWRKIHPLTDGNVLRALKLPPGPHYRAILGALRGAWLDGTIHSPEEEQALLTRLVQEAREAQAAQPSEQERDRP